MFVMNSSASAEPAGSSAITEHSPLTIFVMGVSGCGKSTVAQLIAEGIGAYFKDGDELHPQGNIEKMAAGIPLTDEDRQPWLEELAAFAQQKATEHGTCVIACSALKHQYRATLNSVGQHVYVFLHGSYELIAQRMHLRTGHFMPQTLLESQFAALDDPRDEPHVLAVDITPAVDKVAANAIALLHQHHYLTT